MIVDADMDMTYYTKYMKYKSKYLKNKQMGGRNFSDPTTSIKALREFNSSSSFVKYLTLINTDDFNAWQVMTNYQRKAYFTYLNERIEEKVHIYKPYYNINVDYKEDKYTYNFYPYYDNNSKICDVSLIPFLKDIAEKNNHSFPICNNVDEELIKYEILSIDYLETSDKKFKLCLLYKLPLYLFVDNVKSPLNNNEKIYENFNIYNNYQVNGNNIDKIASFEKKQLFYCVNSNFKTDIQKYKESQMGGFWPRGKKSKSHTIKISYGLINGQRSDITISPFGIRYFIDSLYLMTSLCDKSEVSVWITPNIYQNKAINFYMGQQIEDCSTNTDGMINCLNRMYIIKTHSSLIKYINSNFIPICSIGNSITTENCPNTIESDSDIIKITLPTFVFFKNNKIVEIKLPKDIHYAYTPPNQNPNQNPNQPNPNQNPNQPNPDQPYPDQPYHNCDVHRGYSHGFWDRMTSL